MQVEFSDYNEIVRRRYEYALGIDTRDYVLLRSVFTDRITMDFADYSGQPAQTLAADDWVANCKVLFDGLDATQHVMTNPLVDVAGNEAQCLMYMKAEHFLGSPNKKPNKKPNQNPNEDTGDDGGYAIGGYYTDLLSKIDGHWRIHAVTLKLFWQRGNRSIMERAVLR